MDERFVLITSYHLVEELVDVLSRPRIAAKYKIDPRRMAGILDVLEFAEVVPGVPHRSLIERDPDDDWVAAPALEGRADVIVTEDQDILELHEFEGVRVLTAADFLRVLRGSV